MAKTWGNKLCDYCCGQIAKYQFKNGKWCCSEKYNSCPNMKLMVKKRLQKNNPNIGRKHKPETIEKLRSANKEKNNPMWGKSPSIETRKKLSNALKGRRSPHQLTTEIINKRYPLFSKIEEIRYNLKKEIQVRCKNHLCENSKEKDGWFTPTYSQLYERIRQVERGEGGCYLYCSDNCKNTCPLYNLISDPFKETETYYTQSEYQIFRKFVLERDNYVCQYCGELATDVHHERTQKLEPFFILDPDFAWSCCKKCHYEKGHSDECTTGSLAKKTCY